MQQAKSVANLYWLDQIQASDRDGVGDKAYYLSYLLQRNYPVVPGFVVCAQNFWDFLAAIDWLEPLFADLPHSSLYFNADNPRQLQAIAQRIRQQILTAPLPATLASALELAAEQLNGKALIFRPSLATQNLKTSGLLESQVVWANAEAVALGLKRAWAEVFRARSLFYWQRSGMQLQQLMPAVLVQPLYSAIASGSLQANSDTAWEIQATWGLGMSVLWGETSPDYYQVHPETGRIVIQQVGCKNIAYNLVNESEPSTSEEHLRSSLAKLRVASPLQAQALSEVQQQSFALSPLYLQELILLVKRAKLDFASPLRVEWTLCQPTLNSEPSLSFIQVYPWQRQEMRAESPTESSIALNAAPLSQSQPIRGLAAAAGKAKAIAQVISKLNPKVAEFPVGAILVASEISPDWLPWLKIAGGLVAEKGGMTAHGAILARELGIPAVVGAVGATRAIKTGQSVVVDGDRGEVYLEEQSMSHEGPKMKGEAGRGEQPNLNTGTLPAIQLHRSLPIATQLLVNLSQSISIERVKNLPIDGVGLLRSELMALEVLGGQHPSLWLQDEHQADFIERMTRQLSQFTAALAPRPVFYRSLDLREFELQGAFSYALDPALFDLELAVLERIQQSGYGNIRLILPFVRSVEEFVFCLSRIERTRLRQHPNFQVWIMAEVPSVLLLLPNYVKAGVQGISIGTNDLTQLLLGIDRNSEKAGSAFEDRSSAVMRGIQQLIEMSKQAGIPCSICGDAPALYPGIIESLVDWGISSISVNVDAVERVYQAIARAEQRLILAAARQQLRQ